MGTEKETWKELGNRVRNSKGSEKGSWKELGKTHKVIGNEVG